MLESDIYSECSTISFLFEDCCLVALSSVTEIRHFFTLFLLISAFFDVIRQGFELVFWVLILRAILSWVSQGSNPIEYVLMQLTEPMLRPIRKIIPPMGGLDLSILIAIIGLQFISILLGDMFGRF